MKGAKKQSKAICVSAERRIQCLELRKAGATYTAIGKHLGISRQAAFKHVTNALAELRAEATDQTEDLIRLEVERLDQLLVGLWDRARVGGLEAVDRVLKIQARRSLLLGLDAPKRMEVKADIMTHEEAVAALSKAED